MAKLRLGPVADDKPAKLTIELRAATVRSLSAYAEIHARENSLSKPLPIEKLIDPMLAQFMATDRAFAHQRRVNG